MLRLQQQQQLESMIDVEHCYFPLVSVVLPVALESMLPLRIVSKRSLDFDHVVVATLLNERFSLFPLFIFII